MRTILLFLTLLILFNIALTGNSVIFLESPASDSVKVIEKLFLHIDRDFYSPGDRIWFKAYLIDATDRILTDHSNNLHVELFSPESKVVESRIIRMDSGLGNGDFDLGKELHSGKYWIRAYTNYMRNFKDSIFFTKFVFVISPSEDYKLSSDSAQYNGDQTDLGFYPESGSLTDSVVSAVAFKATDITGRGCEVDGTVYSFSGDSITSFRSTHKGMGKFSFMPLPGKYFYAVLKNEGGNTRKYELPESMIHGIILSVADNNKNELKLELRTNAATLNLVRNKDLTLSVSARGMQFKNVTFRIRSLFNYLIMKTDDLPDGIINLRIAGTNDLPLCERLVYIHNKPVQSLTISTDKSEYRQRDSVTVKLSLNDSTFSHRNAFISFSATDKASMSNSEYPSDISSWFLLESDVRGPVEEPSYYFDQSNLNRFEDLDILLLTQGWRDFGWKYATETFPSENGFTISGRVRKLFSDVPLKGAKINIGFSREGKLSVLSTSTDTSGNFKIGDISFTGIATIVASSIGRKEEFQGWLSLDSGNYNAPGINISTLDNSYMGGRSQAIGNNQHIDVNQPVMKSITTYRVYAEIKESFQKKYKLSDTIRPGEVTVIARRDDAAESIISRSRKYIMTSNPYASLILNPNMRASNVFQLMRQFMYGSIHQIERPLFMVDGVKVSAEIFAVYPISDIARIDVLKGADAAVFGPNTETPADQIKPSDGVFSITSLSGDPYYPGKTSFHTQRIKYPGYDKPQIFYSPKHYRTLVSDYNPDLRTTIFWEPNLALKSSGNIDLKFFNSDRSSIIRITVEGITSDGIPVTGNTEYSVK